MPLENVMEVRAIGTDPGQRAEVIARLFESGVTIVNLHSGQPDQRRVIDFYGEKVLPQVKRC